MEVLHGFQSLSRPLRHPVLTIGNFDGVHLGHQKIIRLAVEKARQVGGQSVAMTFRPHPLARLRPQVPLKLITTYDEKLQLLASVGVDLIIEQPFTPEFADISANEFFQEIILKKVHAEAVVIGYDFGFGKNREGGIGTLRKFAHDKAIEIIEVGQQVLGGEVISSSRVRELLLQGAVAKARALLGREFSYTGVVEGGESRGKGLGFPTANLGLGNSENKLVLPNGVYVTHAVLDGNVFPSVTNFGVSPTFKVDEGGGHPARLECHILDFGKRRDLASGFYGKTLEVGFLHRLRDERRFESVEALKAQIKEDIRQSRQLLGMPEAAR